MKQLTFLFMLCLFSFSSFANGFSNIEVIAQEEKSTTLKISLSGYDAQTVQTPNGAALVISIEDGTPMLKEGAPDLPKLNTSLWIDDDTSMEAVILSSSFTDYQNIEVAPSKGNLMRNVDPSSVPYTYGAGYETDAFFPNNQVQLRDPYIFRDYRGQTVLFYPVQYNAVTKTLRVTNEMIVKVQKNDGLVINPRTNSTEIVNSDYHELYKKRFINYNDQNLKYDQVGEIGNMLIVANGELIEAMQPFVDWKKQKGIPTEIVDIATIGSDASTLFGYIEDYYNTNGLTYLLLVGDVDVVPTLPTGQDNACDHCFSYMEGNDHFPEFFVGRFIAADVAETEIMVNRTLEYEMNPAPGNWTSTAIGAASSEGPGDDGEYDFEHMNNIKTQLLDYTFTDVYEFYQDNQTSASPTGGDTADESGQPSASDILEVLNGQGASLYNYVGHGDHGVLITGNFDVDAVNSMEYTGAYPFMVAVACCVGDFQNDFGSGDCLGEAWIRANDNGQPTGGIGGCFSSILQSWAPPMEGQDEMTNLITESAQYDIRHSMGGVVIHGCGSMNDAYGGGGDDMTDSWCIFGDPSVILRTAEPVDMVVTHQPTTFIGTTALTINCDTEDAMISLFYQDEILGTGFVSGGIVNIDFEAVAFPEDILVTATAYNRMAYQGPIAVVPAEGPYVVLNNYTLNDPTGNVDNLADYAESIVLDINLANVGIEWANNVNAVISTTNPSITITDNMDSWGNLEDSTNVTQMAAFAFDVADDIEDQTTVIFAIEITDDADNIWNGTIPVTVKAPELDTYEMTLDETVGGNGNGRLEEGETFTLTIPSVNIGHSASPDAIGTLATISSYLTISEPTFMLGAIGPEGALVDAVYNVTVANSVPSGTPAELEYTVVAGNYSAARTFSTAINLIIEDFETDDLLSFEWSTAGDANWFTSNFDPYEGDVCSQSGNIDDDELTDLVLTIDVLDDSEISFARKTSTEDGWDFLRFYIDGSEVAAWSGNQDWAEVTFPVSSGVHTFKWSFVKDYVVSAGFDATWVDEIILPPHETIVNVSELLEEFKFVTAPNPFVDATSIHYQLKEQSDVRLTVYNNLGQQVKVLDNSTKPAGTHSLVLDGSEFAEGLYFVTLQIDNEVITKTIVKQ